MTKDEVRKVADHLLSLIDRHVTVAGRSSTGLTESGKVIDRKIDLLDRILEMLRIERRHLENHLEIEEFVQGHLVFEGDVFRHIEPQRYESQGSGTAPIRLQPKLLLFLLINHKNQLSVYDIIDGFVRRIWDHLEPLDFKKTRTGVTRCFTNTRFAALTLRAYGLLKFTRAEAFKTWSLSLPGFLVASSVMAVGNWAVPQFTPLSTDLHPDIRDAFEGLTTLEAFIGRLSAICKPDVGSFRQFDKALGTTYGVIREYRDTLNDEKLSKEQRAKKASELLKQLEGDEKVRQFYDEFARCLRIGDLLTISEGWK